MIKFLYTQKQAFEKIILAKYQELCKVGATAIHFNHRSLYFSTSSPIMILKTFLTGRTVHSLLNEYDFIFSDLWRLQKWNSQMKNC
jgi:hypothetical protein